MKRRAFTMVELLVAMLILGVVTALATLTFNAITRAWTVSTEYMDKMQRCDYALEQVVSGLKSMYYPHAGEQSYTYGFYLTDNGDGKDERNSDVIEWAKTGTAIVGNQNASVDTVHRVQLMILEEGNRDYKDEIPVTGLYARMCPDPALRPKKELNADETDYSFSNLDMYQPILVVDGIVGMNCRVMKDAEEGKLSDAYVCANDELAMVSAIGLSDCGLECPGDALVTGFDYIGQSKVFYPSISSVDQDSEKHGKVCAGLICDMIDGKEVDDLTQIPCTFIPSESCGCKCSKEIADRRLRAGTLAFRSNQIQSFATWHTIYIERAILKCESFSEIKQALTKAITEDSGFEGDNFHILFDPESYGYELKKTGNLDYDPYSDKQDVIYSIRNGKLQTSIRSIKTANLIPGLEDTDPFHMYVFIPLHEREMKVGYIIFTDCYDQIESAAVREYGDRHAHDQHDGKQDCKCSFHDISSRIYKIFYFLQLPII